VYFRDPIRLRAFEAWKLRVLLAGGLIVLFVNSFGASLLEMRIPHGLDFYLTIASCYFAMNPQRRIEQFREQVFVLLLFPGAFVTAMLPFYTFILFAIQQGW
jgi:hypothetical protein